MPAQMTRQEFVVTFSQGVGQQNFLFSGHNQQVGSLISPVYFSCHCFVIFRAINHLTDLLASAG